MQGNRPDFVCPVQSLDTRTRLSRDMMTPLLANIAALSLETILQPPTWKLLCLDLPLSSLSLQRTLAGKLCTTSGVKRPLPFSHHFQFFDLCCFFRNLTLFLLAL